MGYYPYTEDGEITKRPTWTLTTKDRLLYTKMLFVYEKLTK